MSVFVEENLGDNVQESFAVFGGIITLDDGNFGVFADTDDMSVLNQKIILGVDERNNLERFFHFDIVWHIDEDAVGELFLIDECEFILFVVRLLGKARFYQ